jgi:ABC-type transporter Mla MlaB component
MRDVKFKLNQPQKGEKLVQLYLGGDLGVNNLTELVAKLKEVEKEFSEFEININDVVAFDLATIQLLVSFKKSCERHKKGVRFKVDLPKDIAELIENTGFTKVLKKL